MNTHSDFHKQGLFAVQTPAGDYLEIGTTAHAARAQAIHSEGLIWKKLEEKGYKIMELAPVAQVVAPKNDASPVGPAADADIDEIHIHWELYSGYAETPAAEKELTRVLLAEIRAVRAEREPTMEDAIAIRDRMYKLMSKYSRLGACDTEPETALVIAIEQLIPAAKGLTR